MENIPSSSAVFSSVHCADDYDSEFEDVRSSKRQKKDDLPVVVSRASKQLPRPEKRVFAEECSKEQGRIRRFQNLSIDAYSRHKEIINHYLLCYRGASSKLKRDTSRDKTDIDVIKEHHCFLWDEEDEADSWGKQLAKKYYDKLFKEYCLTDLSRYKENKIALRWRTEAEVIKGKGQFMCGYIKCSDKNNLRSWEVNFGYVEHGIKKNALVKLRLCPKCSYKLNFCHKRKEVTRPEITSELIEQQSAEESRTNSAGSEESNTLESPESKQNASGLSANDIQQSKTIESDIWKQPSQKIAEISRPRDEDFENFLTDLLL